MASAMIATGVARLISRSMYDELAMLLPLPVAAAPPDPTGVAMTGTAAPSPRS
jgi:hypothetical protein